MPKICFSPMNLVFDVESDTKILLAATRNKVPIRFGCGACRCGTCGVAIDASNAQMSEIKAEEEAMLKRLNQPLDGSVRMACRARIKSGECKVDLDFQDTYEPPNNF